MNTFLVSHALIHLEKRYAVLPAQNTTFLSAKFSLSTKKPGNLALRDIFQTGQELRNLE